MRESLIVVAAAVAAAAAIGLGLRRLGGREGRPWAVPAACAILIGGVGYAFFLPSWLNAGIFILALFLFHRTVRTRLERSARSLARVEVPEAGLALRSQPDPMRSHTGVWAVDGAAAAPRLVALGPSPSPGEALAGPPAPVPTMLVTLDLAGETEDEYSVVLRAKSSRYCPGVVVCHHVEARGEALGLLAEPEQLSDLPGLTRDIVVRAVPAEFGFRLLDLSTLALISDVLALRREGREVYVHVSGPDIRVVSSDIFETEELSRLLCACARLLQRVHSVGVESQ